MIQIVLVISGLALLATGLGLSLRKQAPPLALPLRLSLVLLGLACLGGGATLAARPAPQPQLQLQGDTTLPAPTLAPQVFVSTPDLYGRTIDEATALLAEAGLSLGDALTSCRDLGAEPPSDLPAPGLIICQSPQAGSLAAVGVPVAYVAAR